MLVNRIIPQLLQLYPVQGGIYFVSKRAWHTSDTFNRSDPVYKSIESDSWRLLKPKYSLPKAIIFDKDGTLIDFHSVWTPWVLSLTKKLENLTGLDLEKRIFAELDFCHFTNKTRCAGVLAHGTTWDVQYELESVLFEAGLSRQHARQVISTAWVEGYEGKGELKAAGDIRRLFQCLKEQGVKVAICTSDSRQATEHVLDKLQVKDVIDAVICSDDSGSKLKPSGSNVRQLCNEMGVTPREVVVVGDTHADMEMGKDAEAAMTIGVLSGISSRLTLSHSSDIILDSVNDLISVLYNSQLYENRINMINNDCAEKEEDEERSCKKASLVIFDKDGTLICFHSMWTPWADVLVDRLEAVTGLELRYKLLEDLGFCHKNKKWIPGVLSQGTPRQNQEVIIKRLIGEGLTEKQAQDALEKSWCDGDHSNTDTLKILGDPKTVFKHLKEHGVKIAICTADSRAATEEFIQTAGLELYVDTLVAGDDEDCIPKPSPHNAHVICKRLNVDPTRTVVIGDTFADMGMGRSARLGATVGVLSGVGEVEDLDPFADHIAHDINDVLKLVLPDNTKVFHE